MTKTISQEQFDDNMKKMAEDIGPEFLKKALDSNTTCHDTEAQKKQHDIDVCVVTYQSEEYMMANPVHWCPASYYISEKFEKDGIRFKIFVGVC